MRQKHKVKAEAEAKALRFAKTSELSDGTL